MIGSVPIFFLQCSALNSIKKVLISINESWKWSCRWKLGFFRRSLQILPRFNFTLKVLIQGYHEYKNWILSFYIICPLKSGFSALKILIDDSVLQIFDALKKITKLFLVSSKKILRPKNIPVVSNLAERHQKCFKMVTFLTNPNSK